MEFIEQLNQTLRSKGRSFVEKQTPKFAILTCSDSRVDVDDLFGDTYNQVFVIENAGNTANNNLGSVGYALRHLHVDQFIVMGHSNCGACKYGFETKLNTVEEVLDTELIVIKEVANGCSDAHEVEIKNVKKQVEIIKNTFPEYASKVVGMHYDIREQVIRMVD